METTTGVGVMQCGWYFSTCNKLFTHKLHMFTYVAETKSKT